MMTPRAFVIGIDLGTTNSALASTRPVGSKDAVYRLLEIEQWVAPGRVAVAKTLPSFAYLPHEGEMAAGSDRLPWEGDAPMIEGASGAPRPVVGLWARERGTQVPERCIGSAKSWLASRGVDRRAQVLPWRSTIPVGKLSPVQVSALYLRHLLGAFETAQAQAGEPVSASDCEIVITVPASFDEVARHLTHEAAQLSGLRHMTFLEEPLAAFYAWIAHHSGSDQDTWRDQVRPGDLVLVCDVGGGTTDFSLIEVAEDAKGNLLLERINVGDHLLLGGDNMDLALAMVVKKTLETEGHQLDHWQSQSLVHSVRQAKEALLSDETLEELPIALTGRGSSLFAQTISTRLTRTQVTSVIVDGFFPLTAPTDMPRPRRGVGLQEFGLSYESDAAISRHLARFLACSMASRQSAQPQGSPSDQGSLGGGHGRETQGLLLPNFVLFNGGVFKAAVLRERVMGLLNQWSDGAPVRELPSSDLDLAVALGAAYYGRMRATGEGLRVASGTARSYYVGIESPMPAVPGYEPPVKGLCLVPQGTDEGTHLTLPNETFGLIVGEPAEFRFFSSNARTGDQVGAVVEDASRDLEESACLTLTLPADGHAQGETVPVTMDASVSEVGVLEIALREVETERRWKLEFNVRAHDQV